MDLTRWASALVVAVCVLMLVRMMLPARKRARLDQRLKQLPKVLSRRWHTLRHGRRHRVVAERLAKDAIELGFYLSFSGILTFQNSTMLRDIARTVPADRLLIETDCPYLTPIPHRGKRNEPAYVKHVAETLATITPHRGGMTAEDIGRLTSENARRLFKIP